jgi:thioredoxin-like negative regulator of GroEL
MASAVTDIPNREVHDKLMAESTKTPTVMYIYNSALPLCKTLTPEYHDLASRYQKERSEVAVRFTEMDSTPETTPMFKFASSQLPVVLLISEGKWAKTINVPTIGEVEKGVEELLKRTGNWKN